MNCKMNYEYKVYYEEDEIVEVRTKNKFSMLF